MRQETEQTVEEAVEKRIVETLPELKTGFNLVEKPDGMPALQVLLAEELDLKGGEAVWIDTGNESSTYALASSGSPSVMERTRIGRAFTPFQHHNLVQRLEEFLTPDTRILVLSNLSQLYVSGQINRYEAEELFEETWNKLVDITAERDLKVMLTMPGQEDSYLQNFIRSRSDNVIDIERNHQGVRYESGDFETRIYRENGVLQTTIPYWRNSKTREVREVEA